VAGDECGDALHELYHFLDGELTDFKRVKIRQHLDDCPPCVEIYEFELELRQVVARKCRETVPDSLKERIARAIGHEPHS
jgi:mycothiol system anti-sigma-R factor